MDISANTYQEKSKRTLLPAPDRQFTKSETDTILFALDAAISACALCEYLKKAICHQHGFDRLAFDQKRQSLRHAFSNLLSLDETVSGPTTLSDAEVMKLWTLLGVMGESGEIANGIITIIDGRGKLDTDELSKELGDLAWYVAAVSTQHEIEFGATLTANIEKLRRRYPGDGYSATDSQARVDHARILDYQCHQ